MEREGSSTKNEGTLKTENYKVLSSLAESNASTVYKVKQIAEPGTLYVLKKIKTENPENEVRARKELDYLIKFAHPRIVHMEAYYDGVGVSGDKEMNILLTYYPRVVPQLVYSGPGFPQCSFEDRTHAVKILRQVAEAVDFIHSQGFRHGDIRPGHILLNDSFDAVLTDFESIQPLVQEIRSEKDAAAVTDPMYEKDPYRAPEIYQPKVGMTIDGKADVWSFGCVIYYVLFSKSPFKHPQEGVQVDNILAGVYEVPEDQNWPASYLDTLRRCLTVNLADRLTFHDLQARLRDWEAPPAAPLPLPTPPPATRTSSVNKKDNKSCVVN